MKKKMFAAALAGLMVISMAAGCGKKPVVTLGEYKGIELTDVTEAAVEEKIQELVESKAELVEVDRVAKNGDTVNINYVGKLNGEAFEGGTNDSEEGTDLELGSGSFIDGFEDGLIGTTAGQTLDLNLTFPSEYKNNPDLAGKEVVFTVTVNAVKETKIPELTDGFVVKNYPDYGSTVEEFREYVRSEMSYATLFDQATILLMENCTVENAPEDEIATVAANMVAYYTSYCEYMASIYGMDTETVLYYFMGFASTADLEAYALESAEYAIKNRLVLLEIASLEGITVTDEIYAEMAEEIALNNGYEDIASMEAENEREDIEDAMICDLVMEFIIEQATIVTEQ